MNILHYMLLQSLHLKLNSDYQGNDRNDATKHNLLLKLKQEAQLSLRDRATRACQLKSGKVLHKCRRLVFEKL